LGTLSKLLRGAGLKAPKPEKEPRLPTSVNYADVLNDEERATLRVILPYTMTDVARTLSLIHAVRYIEHNSVPGDIVECGVWRGGSMMAVARTLLNMGVSDRQLHLYDTFEGMTAPTSRDIDFAGVPAAESFNKYKFENAVGSDWCFSSLEEVKSNMESTGYPPSNIHYVKGKVEDTLPGRVPDAIALLRLDTDWYESTRCEMVHLFPRLHVGGILIVDDYLGWQGAHEAVNEYLRDHKVRLYLDPTGHSAVVGVKQAP
jgi:O-methyltransferase